MTPVPQGKGCTVAYATRARQYLWHLLLPAHATVADALTAARSVAPRSGLVPWESAAVGICGEPCARTQVFADGDRIELYRPLLRDPRERRRERVQRERRRNASAR